MADRQFPVSITGLTSQGCEARFDAADAAGWDRDTDFCKLTIGDQLSINGRVIAISGNSAQIGFFGHIHPIAVDKLQRFGR
ncbi:hypothetical protein D2V17_18080 [Aurantiacibacter xanthus]|uniref:Uncharacterized protein n=1 Tax=Aurantiacibacter xanthus TaxID=1784712 RepID=A0A3A1P514_9SPHN|nr:hypothetical protein [Aurantiacibacter xanthus]RIV81135.1 hypothetical protein D2V17_18080 [Aurantiacibacter xanthus]